MASTSAPLAAENKNPKNIVICCDGTGNQFDTRIPQGEKLDACNSNVVRLYTALCVDNGQVAYYHPGVGTMGAPTARNKVETTWTKWMGLAFGRGFREDVLDAYSYLMQTFNDGDKVFLFGFSRGAYTVRALAGLLHGYGLLCRGNQGHMPYAWSAYVDQLNSIHNENKQQAAAVTRKVKQDTAFRDTFSHRSFKIDFLGVWDTVSSIGWISAPLELLHVAQNPSMIAGRQAISIDERRCFYQDNLWGDPFPYQDILQVWFSGVHSDVGGSYPNTESYLSNESLEWMLTEAEHFGLRLDSERRKLVLGKSEDIDCSLWKLYHPTPHPGSKAIPHNELEHHRAWWLLEYLPQRYFDKSSNKMARRIPRGAYRQIPPNSYVHGSVKSRSEDFGYNPPNLDVNELTPIDKPAKGENPRAKGLYRYKATAQTAKSSGEVLTPVAAAAAVACIFLGALTALKRS